MPAPSTRPHAFTMSGPLEGLQRDWLMNGCQQDRGHRSRLQQQQHQMLYFQPKPAAKITMFREPTTFCCPVSAAQQPRRRCRPQKHSPPPSIGRQQQQEKLLAKSLLGFPPPSDCGHTFGQFMRLFDEGQLLVRLPVAAAQKHAQVLLDGGRRKLLDWVVNPAELGEEERRQLVQRFAMGLPAEKQPYSLIASHGLKDLLFSSATGAADLAECLPAVMPHLRLALNSGNLWKKLETLELLREMAQLEGIGHRLVPYFRMLLPSLRIGLASSRIANSSADVLDRHQQQERLVNAIDRTLLTLEQMGGPRASESIKHFSNRLL